MYVPKTMPVPCKRRPTDGKSPCDLTAEGVVYAYQGTDIYKTADFLETPWEEVAVNPTGATIAQLRKLDTGKILVFNTRNEIWLSDEAEANFQKVFEPETRPDKTFGLKVYGNIILMAGYAGAGKNQCFMSRDYGETWHSIITHPYANPGHFHDIAYDPYENLIWASSGDAEATQRVFYSNDWGLNWDQHTPDYPLRTTQIIPLPECVLFLSDDGKGMRVYRYDREPDGTEGKTIRPYLAWHAKRRYTAVEGTYSHAWGTTAAIKHGENGGAFFGWLVETWAELPGIVWGTKDGKSFLPVFVDDDYADPSSNPKAIIGCWGPDKEYNVIAHLRAAHDDEDDHLVVIEFPGWVEVSL